jgi:hypothetical protein
VNEFERPSPDCPLLVGLLVDVSASMLTSINNRSGRTINRLESFRDSLEDLVKKAKELSFNEQRTLVAPLIHVFAYGFGFGNPIALLLRRGGADVRDLLDLGDGSATTVPIDRLADDWWRYRRHIESLAYEMAGSTPMVGGFEAVLARFENETRRGRFATPRILFILSDGEPDNGADIVRGLADRLKTAGVLVVSCYVTEADIAAPRHLYGQPQSNWPNGATLMFDVASVVPPESPFNNYLREFSWEVDRNGRLFTQVNQSELLAEFLNLVLSPIRSDKVQPATLPRDASVQADRYLPQASQRRDRVFVSYAHEDSKWLERLQTHLKPLEREGRVDLWSDTRIRPGADWRSEILSALDRATIAVLLVSADFLASDFIANNELPRMLASAQSDGLTVLPVIIGPSQFDRIPELSRFQAVNSPDRPLVGLRSVEREEIWNQVAKLISERTNA